MRAIPSQDILDRDWREGAQRHGLPDTPESRLAFMLGGRAVLNAMLNTDPADEVASLTALNTALLLMHRDVRRMKAEAPTVEAAAQAASVAATILRPLRPPFETFKSATCRGSTAFGTACGTCEKCRWEQEQVRFALAGAVTRAE